jgi:hypothetical protein
MKKKEFLPPFISRVYPHVIHKPLQPNRSFLIWPFVHAVTI